MAEYEFIRETDGIFRLKVPFEDLYTSVFLVQSGGKAVLVDCATTEGDVDEILEPALRRFGVPLAQIDAVVVTHGHGDHAGGLGRILQKAPHLRVVRAPGIVNGLEIRPMGGHTLDFVGVFVPESRTLISGDGLQGEGVGKYRCSLESRELYLQTIEQIAQDERIENILFSHAYEPWRKDGAFGRTQVKTVLQDCKKVIHKEG